MRSDGPCSRGTGNTSDARCCAWAQIEGEFPQILPIRESLIKYVFEPAAEKVQPFSSSCTGLPDIQRLLQQT